MYVYNYCSLLFNFEGADGSTTLTDSSRFSNTLTASGNARIRTADAKIGSSSFYVDGTGDYAVGSTYNGPIFGADATKNYSMECWVRIKTNPAADGMLFGFWKPSTNNRAIQVAISSTREVLIKTSTNGTTSATNSSGNTLALDTWTNVRVIIFGAPGARYVALYIDGVFVYITAALTLYDFASSAVPLSIGADAGGGSVMSESYYDSMIVQNGTINATPTTVEIDNTSAPVILKRRSLPVRRALPFVDQFYINNASFDKTTPGVYHFTVSLVTPIQSVEGVVTPTGSISGTVTELGVPKERIVRAYRRDTGELVDETTSNPTTGAYTISVFAGVEHNLVCLDDTAGTVQNDLIKRKTAP